MNKGAWDKTRETVQSLGCGLKARRTDPRWSPDTTNILEGGVWHYQVNCPQSGTQRPGLRPDVNLSSLHCTGPEAPTPQAVGRGQHPNHQRGRSEKPAHSSPVPRFPFNQQPPGTCVSSSWQIFIFLYREQNILIYVCVYYVMIKSSWITYLSLPYLIFCSINI